MFVFCDFVFSMSVKVANKANLHYFRSVMIVDVLYYCSIAYHCRTDTGDPITEPYLPAVLKCWVEYRWFPNIN